jgi:hypothetical protein
MVQRKNPIGRGDTAQRADSDLLIKAARMVGTALGTISATVRGSQSQAEPKPSKEPELKRTRSPKATTAKKTARKAKTKTTAANGKTRAGRQRKASGR